VDPGATGRIIVYHKGDMYTEYPVSGSIKQLVESVWSVRSESEIDSYPVFPDACADLIYSPSDGLQVVGTMTKAKRFHLSAGAEVIGIRFQPGIASGIFSIPLHELTDKIISFGDLSPVEARIMTEQVIEKRTPWERLVVLMNGLQLHSKKISPLQSVFNLMVDCHGQVSLEMIARSAGLSLRQFRRRCMEATGVSPKLLCRILRFRDAVSKLSHEKGAEIAAAFGYYDQAHWIAEFREFTGITPGLYLANKTL
jgi:AraC-like DNA-binding protein